MKHLINLSILSVFIWSASTQAQEVKPISKSEVLTQVSENNTSIKISEEDKYGLKNLLDTFHSVVAIIGISKIPMACPDCHQSMYDFPEDPKCPTCGKDEWHDYPIMQNLVDSVED